MSDHEHHHHDHGHSHDHSHDEGDTYFIDQLCMVGLSGAFGVICLCLWFWQTKMLNLMLGAQFHLFVLGSGFALVAIALTRAVILWFQSRDPRFLHKHDHQHSHEHQPPHEHEHHVQEKSLHLVAMPSAPIHSHPQPIVPGGAACGHDHKPGETCGHDHAHEHTHEAGKAHTHAPTHHHDHDEADHDHGWAPWRYVVVLVPIILFLLGLPNKPPSIAGFRGALDYEQLILAFTSIVYEALPFIALGVVIAGLLEEFVPQQAIAKIIPRNRALAILLGGILGLVFPMCECGIIVVMKRLLRKGLPLSVCIAYMLAGPVINVIVMGSTYVAFNPPQERDYILGGPWSVVAWRVGLSYVVAFITALLVDWQWNRHGNRLLHPSVLRGLRHGPEEEEIAKRSWPEKINNITQTALHDFVDIMAFLVLGAVLAAGGKYLLGQTSLQDLFQETPAVAILIMMGIAVLFCLCSEADAFVAANFPLYWPPASKLAFLVLGPMLDLKLYLMYTRVFRTRLILTIILSVVTQIFAYTSIIAFFDDTPIPHPTENVILSPDVETHIRSIAFGPDTLSQLVHVGVAYNYTPPSAGEGIPVSFGELEASAGKENLQEFWRDKIVEVRGQFLPHQGNVFMLARYKISCCANDKVRLTVPCIPRETIDAKVEDWIRVTGKVEYREYNGSQKAMLLISSKKDVVKCAPDPNPYVQ